MRDKPKSKSVLLQCSSLEEERVWWLQNGSCQSVTGVCPSYTPGLSHEYLSLVMPQLVAVAWHFLKAVINRRRAKLWPCWVWCWCVPCARSEIEFSHSEMVFRVNNSWWGWLPEGKTAAKFKSITGADPLAGHISVHTQSSMNSSGFWTHKDKHSE